MTGRNQRDLAEEVSLLRREVHRAARSIRQLEESLESLRGFEPWLRTRGLEVKAHRSEPAFIPHRVRENVAYYDLLRHYSFRLFLRDVIRHRSGFGIGDLVRYCSRNVATRYLAALLRADLVRRRGRGRFVVARPDVRSFGPTLEWYVAAMLERDYGMQTAHGLRLNGAAGGGDFDVLARWGDRLVCVEAKASPPRNIEIGQVEAFLRRVDAIRPQVAIFFNDTQLRMGDKIAVLFREALRQLPARSRRKIPQVVPTSRELFSVDDRLFIVNSDPDAAANFRVCFMRFLRSEGWGLGVR